MSGDFDFLYLPTSRFSRRNLSYCFINFVRPEVVDNFRATRATWNGQALETYRAANEKRLRIIDTNVQGKEASLMTIRAGRADKEAVVFFDGQIRSLDEVQDEVRGRVAMPSTAGGSASLQLATGIYIYIYK